MSRLLLIFILLITFNANSIAGAVMMSNMGTMDISMSHDCDDSEMLGMDMFMLEHCDSDSLHHDSSDEHTCGTCLFHCSSAVLVAFDIITPVEPSLPEFQYLMSRTFSVYSRMLRPPQTA